jgi:hypothetical protein
LEFLIASDIVGTVAIGPTFQDLGILALLVLIRTFLSFTLELEISGRWPWQESLMDNESKEEISNPMVYWCQLST